MSTDSASTDLAVPGAAPPAPMTVSDVWAERSRLLSDDEYRAKFLAGDAKARVKMNEVMAGATRWGFGETVNIADFPPAVAQQISEQRQQQIAVLREQIVDDIKLRAAIPEPVAKMVREGQPVTAAEKREASAERDRLFADAEWVKRYRNGDTEAQSRLALLQIIRAAPLKAA
jgi:hypothetical protein